jgi:hypothetical protein
MTVREQMLFTNGVTKLDQVQTQLVVSRPCKKPVQMISKKVTFVTNVSIVTNKN